MQFRLLWLWASLYEKARGRLPKARGELVAGERKRLLLKRTIGQVGMVTSGGITH